MKKIPLPKKDARKKQEHQAASNSCNTPLREISRQTFSRHMVSRLFVILLCAFLLVEITLRKVTPQEHCQAVKSRTDCFDASDEIHGPNMVLSGNLIVFETSESADWCLAPSAKSVGKWAVDTSGRFLYFASTEPGEYTVCAAIVVDGKPKVLFKTFQNGTDIAPAPEPQPDPEPQPEDDLALWIRLKTEILSRTKKFDQEKELFASCFQTIVSGVEHGSIRSAASARAQLRICASSKVLECSDESARLWRQFLEQLSVEIEKRCQDGPNDTQKIKTVFNLVSQHLRSVSHVKQ